MQHVESFTAACEFQSTQTESLRCEALLTLQHVESEFPDEGSNPHLPHWKVDS